MTNSHPNPDDIKRQITARVAAVEMMSEPAEDGICTHCTHGEKHVGTA